MGQTAFDEKAAIMIRVIGLFAKEVHSKLEGVHCPNHIDIDDLQVGLNGVGLWICWFVSNFSKDVSIVAYDKVYPREGKSHRPKATMNPRMLY